jgi:hypothetical protein
VGEGGDTWVRVEIHGWGLRHVVWGVDRVRMCGWGSGRIIGRVGTLGGVKKPSISHFKQGRGVVVALASAGVCLIRKVLK